MSHSPLQFSVLTPTWNRSGYLERVFDALAAQTFKNFEWIVADDGSTDNTYSVVQALAAKAYFTVIYIRSNHHVGKICMDNEAVRQASGQLILWCDSDDWLLPNALQRLCDTWNSIPISLIEDYVGVTALAATNQGVIANPFPDVAFKDVSWNDLSEKYHVTSDMLFCARADALKAIPFPEVDMVIPESVVWTALGHRLSRLIPEILKKIEYGAEHAISFSGNMSYNRGRAHALAATRNNLIGYRRSPKVLAWRLITYIRYCIHGDMTFGQAIKLWGGNSDHLSFYLAFPFALVLALKDRWQGKVRKTHLEFLSAQVLVCITSEKLGASRDALSN
jgi:glycosyltransferase involved in cell wall biosynthesis